MQSVVVLCFFPAFTPPASGGEMRLGNLYRALSRTHDVTLLTSTDPGARFEEIQHTPRMRELRYPKDSLWRHAYATLERAGLKGELSALAFALAVSDPRCELRMRARELAAGADAVIHEFPFSEPIFSDGCSCPEIYNSHNFEASLLASVLHGEGFEEAWLKLIRMEGNLVQRCRRVFATSASDAEKFRLFYGADEAKLGICPNGLDPQELVPIASARAQRAPDRSGPLKLLFFGSAHQPNVEAGNFLIQMAPSLPDCELVLAGGLCGPLAGKSLPASVSLAGRVGSSEKLRLLSEADVFVNPPVLGSGTSLKALEALGAGIPMVSTPEGVRGLDLEAGVHCEIAARPDFVQAICRLRDDAARCSALAAAGRAWALAHFSWDRIATDLQRQLGESPPAAPARRPLVLELNDYPVLQPGSGGVSRVRNLVTRLDCDVVLASFGHSADIAAIAPNVLHVTVPKTRPHHAFELAVNEGERVSVNDGVASLFAASNRALREIVCALARRADGVVFEHPYMAPLLDPIRRVRPALPVVYSSHNVEATHKAQILRSHRLCDTLSTFIGALERQLACAADLTVCCTQSDAAYFAGAGARTLVVPNGCVLPDEAALAAGRQARAAGEAARVGFLGSAHGPNVEAATFIVQELAPALPDAHFELVGGVCAALQRPLPPNVVLHGVLSESDKTRIMAGWAVALNPVPSGGGSSLKLPDYMAHGLVSLSTPSGARGFAAEAHDAGEVAQTTDFARTLGRLLEDPAALARRRDQARRYAAERLTWDVITAPYRDELHRLFGAPAAHTPGPRLLVVTYRYTEPSLGGAEEYLIEILKRLRPRFSRIDLAAVDVEQITNRDHFACGLSTTAGGAATRVAELFDCALFFAHDEPSEGDVRLSARALERAWKREERELFTPFAAHLAQMDRLLPLAGFFDPELRGESAHRWTSPEFSFLVPPAAHAIRMAGQANMPKTLRLALLRLAADGKEKVLARHETQVAARFDVTIRLPAAGGHEPLILCCETDEHDAPGDHRPLGLRLESAAVLTAGMDQGGNADDGLYALTSSAMDLAEQIDERLRLEQFSRWIRALHEAALRRDAQTEAAFAALRGPHAPSMQAWVAAHAHEYDCVLVQGIPFDVIPRTVETLKSLPSRPRVVTLPHFHGDDRFYYWRRYLESFEAADATLLFSSSIAQPLRTHGRIIVVPGGGVPADEHADPHAGRAFRKLRPGANPFFLVLGRKTASKGYDQVVRVHQQLRRSGLAVDLVLIGPDEDGRKMEGSGVHYLGRQPREVTRGALRGCVGLITMSRSESFGIVLCEAWQFGKPVIANRACYAFRELVEDGATGMLVGTDDELAVAMRMLATQAQEGARMGAAGFDRVQAEFTWDKVADACFGALVPGPSPAPEPGPEPAAGIQELAKEMTEDA